MPLNRREDGGIVFVVLQFSHSPRRTYLVAVAALIAFCASGTAHAQTPVSLSSHPSIRLSVENPPQIQPVSYSLEIAEDGSGIYRASLSGAAGPGEMVQIAVQIHEPLLSHLFGAVRSRRFFAGCGPMGGRIAFTGKKTLNYSGPEGAESCTFNFAREKSMNQVADELMAVAYTLQEGVRLNRDHRYDRLGLYDELASLQDAAQEHRALELQNIAPELQAIAQDDEVMNIARRRAQALLAASTSNR